nr:site-specific DNA-methyltransferase [Candidatus Sigynarchaeota archaeon]
MGTNFVKLIRGNCLDGLKRMSDASIDLVVTSPPYNINLKSRNNYTTNYFDNIPESTYRENIKAVLAELSRITKDRGSVWINMKSRWMNSSQETVSATQGSLEPPTWILEYTRGSLHLKNLVIWNYDINSDTQNNKFHPRYEFLFFFVKDPKEYNFNIDRIRIPNKTGDKRNNPLGANPSDVWYIPLVKGNSKERSLHPAQFPETMVERIIASCSNEGDVVLDPFFGSGTTLKVAIANKRNAIGFEIEPNYVQNARERLAAVIKSNDLTCNLIIEES